LQKKHRGSGKEKTAKKQSGADKKKNKKVEAPK
jgi:hypothetical protein